MNYISTYRLLRKIAAGEQNEATDHAENPFSDYENNTHAENTFSDYEKTTADHVSQNYPGYVVDKIKRTDEIMPGIPKPTGDKRYPVDAHQHNKNLVDRIFKDNGFDTSAMDMTPWYELGNNFGMFNRIGAFPDYWLCTDLDNVDAIKNYGERTLPLRRSSDRKMEVQRGLMNNGQDRNKLEKVLDAMKQYRGLFASNGRRNYGGTNV